MPRRRSQRRSSSVGARAAIFAILALALLGGATYALWPKELNVIDATATAPASAHTGTGHPATGHPASSVEADVTLRIDMSGFTPPNFTIPANRLIRVKIVNPDNAHHSDGGGIHQFAAEKLGVDVKVPPETIQVITIPPTAEGDYSFYCDTCCGGKQNPTMQGVIKVRA
jgi:cytochrome c oxidase subunit 2